MSERKKGPRFYTTSKSASQSVGEVVALLSEFGADSYQVQNRNGKPVSITFLAGGIVFQLSPQIEGMRKRLEQARSKADPAAVAWAQLRHWTELQLEIIESGVLTTEQAFGGYALTSAGHTVADMLGERHAELMPGETRLLPPGIG